MKLNNKGFTLIELLASMVILSILMMVAVPNVVGILNNNRNTTYIEDAKKLSTNVEYAIRRDDAIPKPIDGKCITVTLGSINHSEFDTAPYGGSYDYNTSFVVIKNNGGKLVYYVQLVENMPEDKSGGERGIPLTATESLYEGKAATFVANINDPINANTDNRSDLKNKITTFCGRSGSKCTGINCGEITATHKTTG